MPIMRLIWGEKIAGWYYRLDQANGMKDYNSYIIGVKTANKVVNVYYYKQHVI